MRLMKRVTGIGGIFFKSENPPQLYDWYEKHLGIQREAHGQGASFHWREPQAADGTEPGPKALTAWRIFPQTTKCFGASKASSSAALARSAGEPPPRVSFQKHPE
jgi:hypothetical protein